MLASCSNEAAAGRTVEGENKEADGKGGCNAGNERPLVTSVMREIEKDRAGNVCAAKVADLPPQELWILSGD